MSDNLSNVFSHAILAGTSFSCLLSYKCGVCFRLPCVAYATISAYSLLGIWCWANPDHGETLDKPYKFMGFLRSILVLPLIVTQVWLEYQYQPELAYLHTAAAILPFSLYLGGRRITQTASDILIAINGESLIIVSFLQENYYGIAAAFSYLFSHLCLSEGFADIDEVPFAEMCNYGLSFFCYCSLQALTVLQKTR